MKVEYKEPMFNKAGSVPKGSVVEVIHGGDPWIFGETYHNPDHGVDYIRAIRLTDGYTDGFDVTTDVIVLNAKVVIG